MVLDVLSNFRSALNYLAWELAKWNLKQGKAGREPGRYTQFPIACTAANFRRDFLKDLHPNHVAVIEFLQPYGPAYMAKFDDSVLASHSADLEYLASGHPLAVLNRLNNTDKHKVLQRVAAGTAQTYFRGYGATDCRMVHIYNTGAAEWTLQPGTTWATIEIADAGKDPKVQVNDSVTAQIAFEERRPVRKTLDQIGATIAQLLGFFEPVFEAGVFIREYAPPKRRVGP